MTTELYTKEQINIYANRIKKYAAISVAIVLATIGASVGLCFAVNDGNATVMKLLDIAISGTGLCVALYLLLNEILPTRSRKNYASKMLASRAKTVACRVTGYGRTVTAEKRLRLKEIRITDAESKEQVLYWDAEQALPDFEGHIVVFKVVNNKIISYGDTE